MNLRRLLVLGAAAVAVSVSALSGAPAASPQAAPPAPTPTPTPTFVPLEISIPALDLTAPIVPVGTEDDGAMGTPNNAIDVAWWAGVRPGEGNTLLAAHRDWKKERGSFYALGDLEAGDEVVVRGRDESLTFAITWIDQVDADIDAEEMLGDQGEPVVTLITCGGPFDTSIRHYTERVVARGVLVT